MDEEYRTLQDVCTRINGLWGEITGKHISDQELYVVLHDLSSAITRISFEMTSKLKDIQDMSGMGDTFYKRYARRINIVENIYKAGKEQDADNN